MERIGTFQTDRLRISAYKGCNFVINGEGCKFCEANYNRKIRKNKLSNIAELIDYTEKHEKRIKHYLVSGGTPPDNGWQHFVDVCKIIRQKSAKPIYAMFSPPPKLEIINSIINAGVTEIAVNIELFDENVSKTIIPGKSKIGIEKYIQALEYSTELLGRTGNVRSLVIVGLEDYNQTLKGIQRLARKGIMPILSIFKPIKGTLLETHTAPKMDYLIDLWKEAQKICEKYSMTLGPLCKACQNNTLTFPVNDKYFLYE